MGAASSKGALGGAHNPNRDRGIGQLVAATHNGYNRHVQKDGTAWPAGNIPDPVSADWTDAYGISAHEVSRWFGCFWSGDVRGWLRDRGKTGRRCAGKGRVYENAGAAR